MVIEKALVVENDPSIRKAIVEALQKRDLEIGIAENETAAIDMLHINTFDLIIADLQMSGISVLKEAKSHCPQTIVILITPYNTVETAVESMKQGAFSYLIKPFSPDTLETILDKVHEHARLLEENSLLRREISTQPRGKKDQLIAESALMKNILSDVSKIAKSHASVFISGESGTGKEMIAQAIHTQSLRAHNPFIKVNCAAIAATLLESEFFGHEKGAFTGAINKRLGRFELADKGTLLLDEISEISIELQPKLLRAIQEMEFERVGGSRPIRVDVRFISTSNRCMKEAIEQKLFREDLYYRLNVVPIHLPPLRERKEDILPLAEYFLEQLCLENQKTHKTLSNAARQHLLDYPWPGNIRELANVIERTVVMTSSDLIEPKHFGLELSCQIPQAPTPKKAESLESPRGITLKEMEKRLILQTLKEQNNNRSKTADLLGISIRTLRNKLNEYAVN